MTGTTTQLLRYSDVNLNVPLAQPLITGQSRYAPGQIPGYIPGEQAVDFYDAYTNIRMQANPVAAADLAAAGINSGGLPSTVGALTEAAVQSASFNAAVQTFYPVDISSGNVTATLPTAPVDKSQVTLKVVKVNATPGTYTLTLQCGGSDVFNVAGGSSTGSLVANRVSTVLQYAHATGIWYQLSGDAALGQALGAAKLGSDGTVGGPSGSALTSSVAGVSWMAGVVADGATDNYAVIQAALNALATTGGKSAPLPPGNVCTSATIVPPQGVTLIGSGSSNGSNTFYGTNLMPTAGSTANGVVGLFSSSYSAVADLNIIAINGGTELGYALLVSGLRVQGLECQYERWHIGSRATPGRRVHRARPCH